MELIIQGKKMKLNLENCFLINLLIRIILVKGIDPYK